MEVDVAALEELQRRILWLSTLQVHWANRVRDNTDGLKVGGHQASSASSVSLMTALWFARLRANDQVAVKPHASPVFHAISYLLGYIEQEALTSLRQFGGLQSYPSQTKDPDRVDISTGSVGLGAAAASFRALVHQFAGSPGGDARFYALVGDAELDEGNVWEAVAEPALDGVPNIRWIVDLNRQSLDRVVPGIRAERLRGMFRANGWRVIDVKYGSGLTELFSLEGGELLRARIDAMGNEDYQLTLTAPDERLVDRIIGPGAPARERGLLGELLGGHAPADLRRRMASLGGHDMSALLQGLDEANSDPSPAVMFAYTVKGWGLPFAGDPLNHSALLTDEQFDALAHELGTTEDWFARPDPSSEVGALIDRTRERLADRPRSSSAPKPVVPASLRIGRLKVASTQESFGRLLTELARSAPDVAERVVTTAPDVATSTNLAGWINRVGVWSGGRLRDPVEERATAGPLQWDEREDGRHIELGISEMNLFMLLSQLGRADLVGSPRLVPIGTVYDPFVCRGLDAMIYALYVDARFILVGTPSGVSLAPEGGAHQSIVTPSLGIELPGLVSYEPAYAQELEWLFLDAVEGVLNDETSSYFRLSTRPVDQGPAELPSDAAEAEERRRHARAGVYRLIDRRKDPGYDPSSAVLLFAVGATVPEAVQASAELLSEGIFASVMSVTSPGLLYRRWQGDVTDGLERASVPTRDITPLDRHERGLPVVTVIDGHPHSLAFVGSALGSPAIALGTTGFGQSGTMADLYRHHLIDADAMVRAALAVHEMTKEDDE